MLFKLVVILVAVTFCSAKVYQSCSLRQGIFVSLKLNDCDVENASFCTVYKGQDINIEISFKNIASKQVIVHARALNLIPLVYTFSLDDAEGCSGTGIDCPLQANKNYTYKATIPATGLQRGILRWELDGDWGKDMVCLKIQLKTEVQTAVP